MTESKPEKKINQPKDDIQLLRHVKKLLAPLSRQARLRILNWLMDEEHSTDVELLAYSLRGKEDGHLHQNEIPVGACGP